jgi:hypothetical protein
VAPLGRLVIALIFAFSGLEPASSVQAVGVDDMADAIRFRTEFGLDSDPTHIAAITLDPNSSRVYGVALSPDEATEMERRAEVESQLEPLNTYLRSLPEFGGAYIDQAAGHVFVLGFTSIAAADEERIAGFLPSGTAIRMLEVANSEADLRDVQAWVTNDSRWLADLGTHALEIPVNPRTNRVEIGLTRLDEAIAASMNERYGKDRVALYETTTALTDCVDRNHCHNPLRAGLQLYDAGCSTGFGVYAGASYYLLTAGHCYIAGHVYQHPNGTDLGIMVDESFEANSSFDGGIVPVPTAQRYSRIWSTNASWFPVISVQTRAQEMVGQSVCLSGRQRADGASCGTVYAIDFPFDACHNPQCSSWTHLVHQRSGTYPVAIGDSGGAVWRVNQAMGVQSSINLAGRGIYSHVSYMQAALNVSVCLWTTCP